MAKANWFKTLLDGADMSKDAFQDYLEETDGDGKRADFKELADDVLRQFDDAGRTPPAWVTEEFLVNLFKYMADAGHTFVTENKP